jgi:ribosomal protein S18 acetylase RimI-like enzyme
LRSGPRGWYHRETMAGARTKKSKSKSLDEIAQKLLAPVPVAVAEAAKPEKATPKKSPSEPKRAKGPKKKPVPTRPPLGRAEGRLKSKGKGKGAGADEAFEHITVRRMHRRDIKRVWDFLKRSFRDVNRETVEYQRPRSKQRFEESYDDEGIEQLLFEVEGEIVGYAESAFEVTGSDNWINPKYFESRDMRPLFVEELATSPDYQGRGVGSFMLEQLEHLARIHGCTHLVLEVAENNEDALAFYRRRSFVKLDAALFMAAKVDREPDLLPPRALKTRQTQPPQDLDDSSEN